MGTLLSYKESRKKGSVRVVININIERTNHTYLSVCGEVYDVINSHRSKLVSCGQCTKEMREFFPEYHDFLDLHLSDLDGKPMHAMENGLYFLKKLHESDSDVSILTIMKHFRISYQEAIEISVMGEPAQRLRISSYYPRWMSEMTHAIKRLEQLCGKKLVIE